MTAFPESTPFKLTIWNILGELQGEERGGKEGRRVVLEGEGRRERSVPRSPLL